MSSKKHRKKLKEQYNPKKKKKSSYFQTNESKEDRENILAYLKDNSNRIVTSMELMRYAYIQANSSSSISRNINYIKEFEDTHVTSIPHKGYMYVE